MATAADKVAIYKDLIAGKTILTTGVSPGGLGASFVTAVAAASPALLILAGRNTAKLDETAAAITAAYPSVATRNLPLDLSSLASVRAAAEAVNSWTDVPHIDVLVNNAGIMATEYSAVDGIESQFLANHVSHFLFTNLLMDKILASPAGRVVAVTSDGHRLSRVRFEDPGFDNGNVYDKWLAYGQSKSANMLMALSLAEKLGSRGLQAYSLHPGAVFTQLARHVDMSDGGDFAELARLDKAQGNVEGYKDLLKSLVSLEQGAVTHVVAAFDDNLKDHNGAYLIDGRVGGPYNDTLRAWATSPAEADRLWTLSENLVGQEFKY